VKVEKKNILKYDDLPTDLPEERRWISICRDTL